MRESKSETVGQAGAALLRLMTLACLGLALPALAMAEPREERAACWEAYNICTIGAERVDAWRTVCYSDYSACMKNPPEVQCRAEDKAKCAKVRSECTERGDSTEVSSNHCREDHQVCLDAFEC